MHRTILLRRFLKTEILLKKTSSLPKRKRILLKRTNQNEFLLRRILNLGGRTKILVSRINSSAKNYNSPLGTKNLEI